MVQKFHGRPRLTFYERGPGPAGYGLPPLVGKPHHAVTHRINPEYTFGSKLKSSFLTSGIGPGAGRYLIPYGLKAKGFDAGFSYTIRRKFDQKGGTVTPGPGTYKPDLVDKPRAPAFTMRIRHPLLSRLQTPAPNVYTLSPMMGPKIPNKLAAAECSLKGDRRQRAGVKTPGPGDKGPIELIKNKAPGFTMRIKWPELKSYNGLAGPGSYDIEKAKIFNKRPAWALGNRYNDFTGVFKTECDKVRYQNLDDFC